MRNLPGAYNMVPMPSAAELFGGFDSSIKRPAPSRAELKDLKELQRNIEVFRPGYPEYRNTVLYKDDRCRRWVHVCDVTLEEGVKPKSYVPVVRTPPLLLKLQKQDDVNNA